MTTLINRAINLLRQSRYTAALTGAGISTPSGIPDFRSPNSGLWQDYDPVDVATIYAFKHRPRDFYNWVRPLTSLVLQAQPNPAHVALAQLETHGPLKALITQNIDTLHSKAGSRTVYEVHGHLREAVCIACHTIYPAADLLQTFLDTDQLPHCTRCHNVLKPNVILFGEMLPMRILKAAEQHARACDLMLVAGSSLEVAPAGDLPLLAQRTGARLIVVNYGPTHVDHLADVVIRADVADVLPRLAAPFIGGAGG